LYDSLEANLIALKYDPHASELIDHFILECTKENISQQKNRFFIEGDPQAILIVELAADNEKDLDEKAERLINELKRKNYGYHYPILKGSDMSKIWALRKAGLGLLSNIPGDAKPVPVIEDTAVDVNDLPAYIREFNETLKKYGLYCVHYAHAGSGELHLRPIINLKTSEGQKLFKTVLDEVAHLVKKYNGSLSGEHGDGRLRGEFIPFMIGPKNYELLEKVKESWDPEYIFNPGKIVKTPPMNTFLRYEKDMPTPEFNTYFDFSKTNGFLRAAEMCNGSGDCRKSALSGGTMCPSYMATKDEKDTTRARANILREMITHSRKENRFDHPEIYDVLDLCLSCKGCKSECPSNVDMARLKAEFLQHYHDANGIPIRSRLIANITSINRFASPIAGFFNLMSNNPISGSLIKSMLGFSAKRTLPKLQSVTLSKWYSKNRPQLHKAEKKVYLFNDEFTNFNDVHVGKAVINLLYALGYEIEIINSAESGRTYLSKGLVKEAKKLAEKNISLFKGKVTGHTPLIGIEPSAILTFRDEYPDLVSDSLKDAARKIAENTYTFEEFISNEFKNGRIDRQLFTDESREVLLHGHCHQKSLSSMHHSESILAIPANYNVRSIPSGCCGMAGSFGYEKEHYDISMQIGELVLLPEVRKAPDTTLIAAAGTSCRHQISDGAQRIAYHPAEILYQALKNNPVG
jgi:Fe-S oxidoreductase